MLRAALHEGHDQTDSDGFRLRGLGFSRLDGFSDVVFGFALTLLVVSLEVPKGFEELHNLWAGFIPFGISFLLLMLVWFGHYTFFRRFGTHDAGTIWLNGVLLFVVLFYVYPLKFLFRSAFDQVGDFHDANQIREVVTLFSLGFTAIYFLFAALYANGYRQRRLLGLSPLEELLTRHAIMEEGGTGAIGLVVIALAYLLPPGHAGISCLAFLLTGVWKTIMGRSNGRAARRMRAEESAASPVT
jgi:uncharacterized membrane protein